MTAAVTYVFVDDNERECIEEWWDDLELGTLCGWTGEDFCQGGDPNESDDICPDCLAEAKRTYPKSEWRPEWSEENTP